MSFLSLGYEKAQVEIERLSQKDASSISSEIKPFTTKAPSHVIEALDALAEQFGTSRNGLVLTLIEDYLGTAFVDYHNGYGSVFNEDIHQFPLSRLESLFKNSDLSKEAKAFLERLVLTSMGMPELGGNYD